MFGRNDIFLKYKALVPRLGCRSEFGDLLHEMATELGCSHVYEYVTGTPFMARNMRMHLPY